MNENCQIEIFRETGWTDKYCSYIVFVDDKEMGRLKQGERKVFYVVPGIHEIFLKIPWSWHRSNKIKLDVVADQKLKLSCRSRVMGWKIVFAFFYAIFCFNNYISLEKTS